MLKHGADYHDLGADHFDRRDKASSVDASSDGFTISASTWRSAPRRESLGISF